MQEKLNISVIHSRGVTYTGPQCSDLATNCAHLIPDWGACKRTEHSGGLSPILSLNGPLSLGNPLEHNSA